ncbi:terminase large subunit [Paenibacillus sp. NPDC093718]|uniref:terminase large subunit n=1 Tax=Paenibacillus sp. NPDC093718 TaxID=3390601 RepID=UPI003D0398F6
MSLSTNALINDRTLSYAKKVLNGSIVAGKWVKLACKRHINDLDRQGTDEFPFIFDLKKANKIIKFAESLMLVEGTSDSETMELFPFQDFILGSLFGWVHKDTGYRRFRTSYVQLARQNGKSLINGVLGLYCSNFDGYKHGQIFTAATKSDQAKIVLNEMIKMINADPELQELFKIKEYESTIIALNTMSTIKALGRDTRSIDGFRPYLAVIDEYHLHKTSQMYKLMEDGTVKLPQCLISVITTAGFDLNSPCRELYDYCCNLLDGVFEQETQFVYIAQMDKDDDIWDPANWIKANPLVAETPEIENIKIKAKAAKEMGGSEERNFMTKTLNEWVQMTDEDYIKIEHWKACESDMTLEDMRGKECYVGLDLSSGGDLTSIAFEFPITIDGESKYFIQSHSFIPKKRLQEHVQTDKAPYDIWARDGLLTVIPGNKTDYKFILKYMREMMEKYDIRFRMICYDPHNADVFLSDLDEFGCDVVEIVQSARNLNQPTEDFKLEVEAGNIIYNRKNKLLTWSVNNAKLTHNSFGECKINKNYRVKRIDPVDAIIDAHKMAMLQNESVDLNDVITEDYLENLGW